MHQIYYNVCIIRIKGGFIMGFLDKAKKAAQEAGVEEDVDFFAGTFSKSLGAIGGFCVSNHPELDLVRYASRPYIFTASSSPSVIASTRAALKIWRLRRIL